jgi:hypothetical protein
MSKADWPEGWRPIDHAQKPQFEAELKRELAPAHLLHGVVASALGRRDDRDDFLFVLDDSRVAVVHLTWKAEKEPNWPKAWLFGGFDEWRAAAVAAPESLGIYHALIEEAGPNDLHTRASVEAKNLSEAKRLLEGQFGIGKVISITGEREGNRLR